MINFIMGISSLFCLILSGLLLCGAANPTLGEPRASISETSHDFGHVSEDLALSHTFSLRNVGTAPLQVFKIEKDCTCTVAEFDRLIPPGQAGRIILKIKPYSVLNQFRKKAVVHLNDGTQPSLTFALEGFAEPIIEIQPDRIIRFRGDPQQGLQAQVKLISHESESWEIKDYRTDIPDLIDVKLEPQVPGKIYILEVRNKRQEAGRYKGKILMTTTSQKRPWLVLRVFADLSPPSRPIAK